jgi:hypothetical protein
VRLLNRFNISTSMPTRIRETFRSRPHGQGPDREDRRVLSGRVEQIFEKDAWSHQQLVGLVHKLAAGAASPE